MRTYATVHPLEKGHPLGPPGPYRFFLGPRAATESSRAGAIQAIAGHLTQVGVLSVGRRASGVLPADAASRWDCAGDTRDGGADRTTGLQGPSAEHMDGEQSCPREGSAGKGIDKEVISGGGHGHGIRRRP
jgi:hypothetical protein